MSDILDRIVTAKRREIADSLAAIAEKDLEKRLASAPPIRDFRAALERDSALAIIAEVKKASPAAGVLRDDFRPVEIARLYEKHGAGAISVLTDAPFFQGELAHLTLIRQAVAPPVLRKDFILDRYQLLEARVAGADAVLLIAEILGPAELPALMGQVHDLGMQALVELYDADNLDRVLDCGADLIGINNRNLRTFVTSLEHTLALMPRMPKNTCVVSESGIRARGDIERLEAAGVRAALIGETLMRAADVGAKLRELRGRD